MVEFSRGIKGHLRIAANANANASAIAECLPADLAAFSQAHPGIRISLEDLTSAAVQAAVASGHAGVGIFVPPQHEPRWSCRAYRAGENVGEPAVLVPQVRERAQAPGRTLKVRLQVRGFDAIAQRVEVGLGVAVLPAVVAHRFARIFAVQPLALDEDWARRPYLLAVRTQEVLPAVVQRFIKALCPAPAPASALAVPADSPVAAPAARQSPLRKR